jgi:hypothetical protein
VGVHPMASAVAPGGKSGRLIAVGKRPKKVTASN